MDKFIPEIWAREVLEDFPKATVGYNLCTTEYEGEIIGLGSKIHIPSAQKMTVEKYTGAEINPQVLASNDVELEITEADSISGEIDRTKQAVSPYNLNGIYQNQGSLALAESSDKMILKAQADGAHADNVIDTITLTPANIFTTLEECATRLSEKSVPAVADKFAVFTPRDIQNIRKSTDYIPAKDLDPNTLITGQVGKIYGFRILESMNVFTQVQADIPNGDPVHRLLPYGMVGATAFANAIPANLVEAIPMEKKYATLIKGLHMYGIKVVRPEAMGVIKVDTGITGTQV